MERIEDSVLRLCTIENKPKSNNKRKLFSEVHQDTIWSEPVSVLEEPNHNRPLAVKAEEDSTVRLVHT